VATIDNIEASMALAPSPPIYVVNPMPAQIGAAQRQALLELDTATIGHCLESGFMDPGIRQNLPGSKLAGTAITVRITTPDSVMAHYALKFARPGDILVIDRGQDQRTACWGKATAYAAAATGLSGVIIDGATSDVADSNAAGLLTWTRGASPVTTKYRGLGGEMNIPISCGGVAVRPGDAILADDNGIVVIDPAILDRVIAEARGWQVAEDQFLAHLREHPTLCYPALTGAEKIVEDALARQRGQG
jgi:4-hydroxy-4-methyl-2-oxoglutarate aldolase